MNTNLLLPQSSCQNFLFTIEGNIGCGKSTFLQLLRQRFPDSKWIEQPVNQWKNVNGKNINMLQKYYQQPKRWGFTFQIYAIFTRIKKLEQACQMFPKKLKISERSILSDKYVFGQIMKDLQYMDESQYQIYKSLYKAFQSKTLEFKTKIIYLRCKPQKCYQRTKVRKRQQEQQIPLQYLYKIHQKHENWLNNHDKSNVLILDTTHDFKGDENLINSMINKFKQFVEMK